MTRDAVFVWGEGVLSHPVGFVDGGDDVSKGTPSAQELKELPDKRLVLIDCRIVPVQSVVTGVGAALEAGKPVLLLCPSVNDLHALRGLVAILPDIPAAALLIRSVKNSAGLTNFDVRSLNYTSVGIGFGVSAPRADGEPKEKLEPRKSSPSQSAFATQGPPLVTSAAAENFQKHVEKAMEAGLLWPALVNTPPTGLKYFLETFSADFPFTYSADGMTNPGEGSATFTWTVWGFLNQTANGDSQYLVAEGRLSLNAGTLYWNDEDGRGFGNARFNGYLLAPMSAEDFVPTSGSGVFKGTVSIPISYEDPMSGYLIWTFTASVDDTVDSWSCKSISNGARLGAEWWFTSPFDAADRDTWKDAFDFWGNVKPLTGASTGSLDVNTIAAWVTSTILSGSQKINGFYEWYGTNLYKGDGIFGGIHVRWSVFPNNNPGFTVDFNPIVPPG